MEDKIPKQNKSKSQELYNLMIQLECPKKDDLKSSEYLDHMYHYTPGNSTSGKYMIEIPRFDSGEPKDWIIFVDLVQKALVGQNVTTGPSWKGY